MFSCTACRASFTRKDNLKRHEKYNCQVSKICDSSVKKRKIEQNDQSSSKRYNSTDRQSSTNDNVYCDECNVTVLKTFYQSHLRTQRHKNNVSEKEEDGIEIINSAFKNKIVTYRLSAGRDHIDFNEFLKEVDPKFQYVLSNQIKKHKLVKINVEMFGLYLLPSKDTYEVKSFNTKNEIVCESTNIREVYESFRSIIIAKAQDFQERDSGIT